MLRLGTNFGDFRIYIHCQRCHRDGKLLPRDLAVRFGREAAVHPLMKKLRCGGCGSREVLYRIRMSRPPSGTPRTTTSI